MQRREFLQVAGAAGLAATAKCSLAAEPASAVQIKRVKEDRFLLDFSPAEPRPMRILQVTDTHFGNSDALSKAKDQRSFLELKRLVAQHKPDFLVHTGDFINNDRSADTSFEAIEVFDDLGVPWTHVLGNHDIGYRSVEEFRRPMKNASVGQCRANGATEYAFRFDITHGGTSDPAYSIFCFDSGFKEPNRRVSRPQIDWFESQVRQDTSEGITAPIFAMIHIPVVEFETLRTAKMYHGNYGERVCFDNDTGDTFTAFKKSARVRGVFSGHDHENDYTGTWQGTELVYGRVSGWSGYGDLPRGGRLIELDLGRQTYSHQIVLPVDQDA